MFQSTLPHGERLFLSNLLNLKRLFAVFCESVFSTYNFFDYQKTFLANSLFSTHYTQCEPF